MRSSHIFLLAWLISLIIQGIYWNHFDVLDGHYWIEATKALMTLSYTMFDTFTYGYPGAPPMMLAIGVHWLFGVPMIDAFYGSLALIISVTTATAAWLCARLRPHLLWWLGTTVALATTSLYRRATPPSAVAMPFIIVIILLSLYIYERRVGTARWPFILLGVAIGVSAAARLDITMYVAVLQALFLTPLIGGRTFLFVLLVAFLFFCVTNPYMWIFPLHHVLAFIRKFFYHYAGTTDKAPPLIFFVKISPFSFIGLLYGTILAGWRRTGEIVPRIFIINLLFLTMVLVAILSFATYRPLWYYSPLLLIGEVVFLLLMLEFTSRASYTIGFTPRSLLGLYIIGRLAVFGVLLLHRSPALFFFY